MKSKLQLTPVSSWGIFGDNHPYIIAGPCSAESKVQVLDTGMALKSIGVEVFRAGIWKPRTSPHSFEGIGEAGFLWLNQVREDLGLKVCTEVANQYHIDLALKNKVDLLWIGARTTSNPFLMQEIADCLQGVDIPILVKNPINQEVALWIGAFERLNNAGITKLGAIHRGCSILHPVKYRNNPSWQMAIELKSLYPELPIFADPSHIAGNRDYIAELCQKSLDLGFDGLMIESHICPNEALSDAKQQITPTELRDILLNLQYKSQSCDNQVFAASMDVVRSQIDVIDDELIDLLKSRMKLSAEIAKFKKQHNIAIIQQDRWETLLNDVIQKGNKCNLSVDFIKKLFSEIHKESIRVQNSIIESID